jgi:hypothetical protein
MNILNYFEEAARRQTRIKLPGNFDPDFLMPMRIGPCFRTSGKSILRPDGEFVFVGTSDFAENILAGKNCFLCGCYPDGVAFNGEHIIPDWLLRYTGISNSTITLPNRREVRYSSYKVRSCVQCNSFLSDNVEDNVSRAIKLGFEAVSDLLEQNQKLVFQWLSLIYYKVHFRDFSLRYDLDHRRHDTPIGALYAWPNFHHIFCVSRSVLFNARFGPGVIGTIRLFRLDDWEKLGCYDYRDHWVTDTLFIRIKDICIYVSFTDAQVVGDMVRDMFSHIPERINHMQSVEIFGEFVSAKMHFNRQHEFGSIYDPYKDDLLILAEIADDFDCYDLDPAIRGSAQVFAFQSDFGRVKVSGLSHEETFDQIAAGELSFFNRNANKGAVDKLSYKEPDPPSDPKYARSLSDESTDRGEVKEAFKRLTKEYFDD